MKYYIDLRDNVDNLFIKALKDYCDLDISDINIIYNENGKPLIENKDIYFSKSYSKDYVVIAFADTPIGADMEFIKPFPNKLPNAFFTKNEIKYIGSDSKKLYEVWTLKEAILKMNGSLLKNINQNNLKYKKSVIEELDNYFITIVVAKK